MSDRSFLCSIGDDPAFRATDACQLVVDPDLKIRAVNPAYTQATQRGAAELLGEYLFDAFPDNPADPECTGVAKLSASLEFVLSRRARHNMSVQRYDVAPSHAPETFVRKVWSPVNSPILDGDGRVAGIVHRVEDITELDDLVTSLASAQGSSGNQWEEMRILRAVVLALPRYQAAQRALAAENRQLSDALASRATIEQAKGILMCQRRCSPDEAFRLLIDISQDTNVKLRDVAAALIADNGDTT
jgi:response regulator NasT